MTKMTKPRKKPAQRWKPPTFGHQCHVEVCEHGNVHGQCRHRSPLRPKQVRPVKCDRPECDWTPRQYGHIDFDLEDVKSVPGVIVHFELLSEPRVLVRVHFLIDPDRRNETFHLSMYAHGQRRGWRKIDSHANSFGAITGFAEITEHQEGKNP